MTVRGALVLAGVCVAIALVIVAYQRFSPAGIYRTEYEGKIVDKSLTIRETNLGGRPARRLLVESKNGERFEVAPGEAVYERARPGMWIRSSRKSGVELSWSETEWAPAAESR